eukprot:TRINITY_DN39099_c0_g1_i2.p1 TRINITY_DN39099_c0_g1~~TRINITY_DN39099_c0_g1_i2.p1  ORF type:complete len:280 (+),score=54.34 TRINITY_DN39099_c0_g1_i2:97-936(+)
MSCEGNALLRSLHAERLARGRGGHPAGYAENTSGHAVQEPLPSCTPVQSILRFSLSEVVSCSHGEKARCLQCAGREPPEVPSGVHADFCSAFAAVEHITRPTASELASLTVSIRSLAAGEILFPSFAALILQVLKPGRRDHFLDLGSGTGRAVVSWALLVPDGTASGIEIRECLHRSACQVAASLEPSVRQRVRLELGDLFQYPGWVDADVLLVNSTGFDEALMLQISRKLQQDTKPRAKAVTLSQPLTPHPPGWVLEHKALYKMTWGNATVFVYQKTA